MTTLTHQRSAPKHDKIVKRLRSAIVEGSIAPGARLPLRVELEDQFGASRVTVQRALDTLQRDGFTIARGRNGTYVADHPPSHTHLGIVFSDHPTSPTWTGYHECLLKLAQEHERHSELRFPIYFGIQHPGEGDYPQLLEDITSQRLAGVIHAEGPWHLYQDPVINRGDIPRVVVMSKVPQGQLSCWGSVRFDYESMVRISLQRLKDLGCQRIASILIASDAQSVSVLKTQAQELGLRQEPFWHQAVSHNGRAWAGNLAQVLMRLPERDRPDGLFISDDNLVSYVCRSLIDGNVSIGQELKIVAHASFPCRENNLVRIEQVGFDIRDLLSKCIQLVKYHRSGDGDDRHISLEAIHEDHVSESMAAVTPIG